MKLRRHPEDFQVQELTDLQIGRGGFALYTLEKQSIGTLEAVAAIAQRWRLPRAAIAVGGLKDKHAWTTQHLSIEGGPRGNLTQQSLSLSYLGQIERPFHSKDISGNRFQIVLRDLSEEASLRLLKSLAPIAAEGVPNYFDDQRFGSLGESGRFIAAEWARGDYEQALWLAVADDNSHDSAADRETKRRLRESWSDPRSRSAILRRLGRRELADHLERQGDFRTAIALLPIDDRGLYLAALQSHVWNRMLAAAIRRELPAEQLRVFELKSGDVFSWKHLDASQCEALSRLVLPLPSARAKPECEPFADLIAEALAPVGLELRQMRVKYPRDSFFSKGMRPAILRPVGLVGQESDDEAFPSRKKIDLSFDLPRGAYATMVIKQLAEVALATA
jgi:tRNA pseudouridine13 synthase